MDSKNSNKEVYKKKRKKRKRTKLSLTKNKSKKKVKVGTEECGRESERKPCI